VLAKTPDGAYARFFPQFAVHGTPGNPRWQLAHRSNDGKPARPAGEFAA
jgi:hypothetical protein